MSRIGKLPITLPKGVTVNVSSSNEIAVKGPKGELKQRMDPDIKVKMEDGVLTVDYLFICVSNESEKTKIFPLKLFKILLLSLPVEHT